MLTCVTHIDEVVSGGKLVLMPLPGMPLIKRPGGGCQRISG
jgi:hypothetical protein